MPELVNYTPYPNFRYYSKDKDDQDFGVVIVKATYEFGPSGQLQRAEEQAPMVFTDRCHGAVNVTSLWHPSDLVPNKPATDVIVNAVARAPNGEPAKSWQCGIKIEDGVDVRVEKALRVTGPRAWQPVWKRALSVDEQKDWRSLKKLFDHWELEEPAPVADVPLRYELAFGGEIDGGTGSDGTKLLDTDHRNPLGRGKMSAQWTDHAKQVPAPQIENPDEPVTEPYEEHAPQGLGPIPPAWLPRRPLGGTYDQNWIDTVWPAWPADYDFAYHNSAHPDLIVKPFLKGTEKVLLSGLAAWTKIVEFDLPGEEMCVDFVREDGTGERAQMNLDTVFLDIAAKNPRSWRVYLSWRVNFEPDAFETAVIHSSVGSAFEEEEAA